MEFIGMRPIAQNLPIPKSFAGRVSIFGTCELTESEADLLSAAFILVDRKIQSCPPPANSFRLNILAFDTPSLTIDFPVPRGNINLTYGYCFEAIFFPVGLWREAKLSKESVLFIMLEEISHLVWHIADENAVKTHVESMLKTLNPKVSAQAILNRITQESILYAVNHPDLNHQSRL